MNPRLWTALALAAGLAAGCTSSPVAPGPTSDVQIRLRMTGGLAGVDYTILVDGSSGAVLGESCVSGCDFTSGETLMGVTDARIREWAERLVDGGIAGENGRDYGNACCDRFHAVLEYADGVLDASVQGTVDLMPQAFRDIVAELSQLARDRLPMIVDFAVDPESLPADPLLLEEVRLNGSVLEIDVEYGGGCEAHALELIAVGGWMESFPVQVRVVLTHDDRDDPCDALVRETVRFWLGPLEEAYARDYPGEQPGERTVVMKLDWPGGSGRSLPYDF